VPSTPPSGARDRVRAGAAALEWPFGELDFGGVVSITIEDNLAPRRVMAWFGFALHTRLPSECELLWVHALDRDACVHRGFRIRG
jgi:RimJ/RimL family protein N-acetyltransferase